MPIQSTYDAFNPQVQTPAPGGVPNFKPAGDNLSFKSPLGEALKGLGELVGTVTTGVDAIIKSNIAGDTEKEVDPQRKQMISDLEATYGTQAVSGLLRPGEHTPSMGAGAPREGTPIQTIGAPQFPPPESSEIAPSLVAGEQKLPKDINDLPGKLNAIYNARNDGHVSETYYWGRLSDIASDIRSRYPRGYRTYIDNKIQEITGRDPANAYIESLIRDINVNRGEKDKARDKLIDQFYQGTLVGRPGVPQMIRGLINGTKSVDEGVDFLGSIQRDDDKMATSLKRYQEAKARKENVSDEAAHYANTQAPLIVNSFFRGMKAAGGQNGMPDISTPEDMYRIAAEYKQGGRTMDKSVAISLATSVSAWIQAADRAMDEDFQKNGVYKDMATDPEKISKIKELHLGPLRQLQEAFFRGDVSAAANVTNRNEAAHADYESRILNNKDLSSNVLAIDYFRKTLGDQGAAALIEREPIKALLNDFSQKGKAIAAQLMTPDEVTKQLGGKDYKSLVDGIEAIRGGARDKGYAKDHPQVIKTYEQLFKDIEDGLSSKDIKPETRQSLVKSIFGPDNFRVLREIAPDKVDRYNPNVVIPGYQSLFYRLTQPDIAANIKALGKPYQDMYMNWVQTAVRTDLFGRDLTRLGEQLNAITNDSANDLYRINWDSKTKNFKVEMNAPTAANMDGWTRLQRNDMPGLKTTIASLNKGLSGMANVAKGLGFENTDVDGFVLDQLVQAGVPGLDKVGQMPSKIVNAIRSAYAEEKYKMEQAKTKRQVQEQKYYEPKYEGNSGTPPPAPAPASTTVKTIKYTRPSPSPLPPDNLGPTE